MPRRAGTVTVNFEAGTATFLRDVELASGKVREFSTATSTSMAGARTSMVSASTALKELSGNFAGSSRAVARLLVDVGGLGPALSAAFPIFGALAFIGILVKIGEGVRKFFKDMEEAPKKTADAFAPLRLSTQQAADDLRVVNDRLEQDIAKLEGKRENNLKTALDEAIKSADKLGESLEKDLKTASDLIEKNKTSTVQKLLFGKEGTEDIKKINDDLRNAIHEQDETLRTATRKARLDPNIEAGTKAIKDATKARNDAVQTLLRDAETAMTKIIDWKPPVPVNKATGVWRDVGSPLGGMADAAAKDPSRRANALAAANAMREDYQDQQDLLKEEMRNEVLVPKKGELEAAKSNAELTKPFDDRIKAMGANLTALRDKLSAIGKPESFITMQKAAGEAAKAIEEVNKSLGLLRPKLNEAQKAQIEAVAAETATTEAEIEWGNHVFTTNKNLDERIKVLNAATAAIGKGTDAARKLAQETAVAKFLEGHENDANFMNNIVIQMQAAAIWTKAGIEYNTEYGNKVLETTDKLQDQVKVEKAVAAVIEQGSAAMRRAELEAKIAQMTEKDHTQAMKDQVAVMREQFDLKEKTATDEEIQKLREQRIAIEAVTGAILQGAEARRKAAEAAHYAEMGRAGQEAAIPEQKLLDEARHQQEILDGATRIVMEHKNRLEMIDQEIAKLNELRRTQGDTLEIMISMRELENQRLDALSKEFLLLGTAKGGLQAFMLEMQASIKTTAQLVYDSLMEATQKLSDELTKLFTGKKFSFAKMAQDIGGTLVHSVVTEALKHGLSKLEEELKKKFPGLGKVPLTKPELGTDGNPTVTRPVTGKPDGTPNNPIWVAVTNQSYTPVAGGPNALQSVGQVMTTVAPLLGGIKLGGGGGGPTPSVTSSWSPRQEGGPVTPGNAYMVGEHGPEPFLPQVSGAIMSNAMAQRTFGNTGPTYFMSVDARGTDPVQTEQRVYRAIRAAHQDAIGTSVRATVMRSDRVPAGR